jgi:hypothetical protein
VTRGERAEASEALGEYPGGFAGRLLRCRKKMEEIS